MSHSSHSAHSHRQWRRGEGPPTAVMPRRVVLVVLAVLAAITVLGLIALWPNQAKVEHASSGAPQVAANVTFPVGTIVAIENGCPGYFAQGSAQKLSGPGDSRACQLAKVHIDSGKEAGTSLTLPILWPYSKAGLAVGNQVKLMETPTRGGLAGQSDAQNGQIASGSGASFQVYGIVRGQPVLWWVIAFVIAVIAVGALRGALALVALGFAGATIAFFTLPSLISGSPGLAVGVCSAAAIMFVVIYLAHGLSMRSSVALLGTLVGVALTAGIAQLMVVSTHLTGVPDDTTSSISTVTSAIDFRGLLTCAIIIAGLGALNDITVTQASAVWELRAAAPGMSRTKVFAAAMRIGRDHIASTIYTIVFAYVGTALAVLVSIYLYKRSVFDLLTYDDIATEVVRTLCSSIGLILAMPVTTALAILLLPPKRRDQAPTNQERYLDDDGVPHSAPLGSAPPL